MTYATIPGWVNVMLVVMGVGFDFGGFAFIAFVPPPTGAIVGGIWLVMGSGMAFFALRAMIGRRDDERIRREGTPATATLLGAKSTGLFINNIPQWTLQLRIDGAGASYETTLKMLTFSPPALGATFTVRIDPARREHVVMADDASPAAPDPASAIRAAVASSSGNASQVRAAVEAALRQAGLAGGESAVVNPDGSRTITMMSTTIGDGAGAAQTPAAAHDPAETIRLLADLERMRASGTLGQAEFDTLKARLLGES